MPRKQIKRVMVVHHFFFAIFFILSFPSWANYEFDNNLITIHQLLFKFKIEAAEKSLAAYKNKPNGIAIYLESFADGLRLVLNEEENLYKGFDDRQTERLERLERLPKNDPYYLFVKSEIKFHSAFVKLKFGHEIKAAIDFRQCYMLTKDNLKQYPSFAPSLKTFGLISVMVGSTPERYMWVLNGFGLYGDVDKGMRQLEEAASSASPFHWDADLTAGILYAFILKNEKLATAKLTKVYAGNPANMLAAYFLSSYYLKSGKAEKALEILSKMPSGEDVFDYHYLEYMKGEIYLQKGQYDAASKYYSMFLASHTSNNYIKDAWYKIALIQYLQGKSDAALKTYEKVQAVGVARFEADKRAQNMAEKGIFPNPVLFKVRMATDGGYYAEAEQLINGLSISQLKKHEEKVEYYYRKGRLKDQMGQEEEAIDYYHKTIELSHNDNLYYAPSACLHLGYIYVNKKDIQKAKLYFENVLFYKNHDYKNSLDNKAKAALDKLK